MRRGTKRWILWVGKLFTLIIYAILLAYSVIVGIAFVLQLLGANPTASFADWIYRAAANITEPFRGIFPTTQVTDRSTFNASLLFALMIYLIVAVLLHGLIDWLTRRIAGIDRAEEQDRQMAALEAQQEATRTALGMTEPVAVPPAVAPPAVAPPVVAPVATDPTWAVPSGDVAPAPQPGDPIYPPNP